MAAGFRALVVSVDGDQLPHAFLGRELDAAFLVDLPAAADPCGENGEFHTFVSAGPVFSQPIPYGVGEVVLRDGRFWYCDLLPA